MRVRPFIFPALAAGLVISGPVLGYAAARHRDGGQKPPAHHVYRLDYVVAISEPGKPVQTTTHTMNLEDEMGGALHAGANIPLVTSPGAMSSPRQDVGLSLNCHLTRLGEDLLLHGSTEISSPAPAESGPVSIRKITANGDALVSPGKPAVIASVQEPVSGTRYEVTVTATKLR